MTRQIITVPKDKCPLDELAEMGESTEKCWIFFHISLMEKFKNDPDCYCGKDGANINFSWKATEKKPETVVTLNRRQDPYYEVITINASAIAFKEKVQAPECLLFLKPEEE